MRAEHKNITEVTKQCKSFETCHYCLMICNAILIKNIQTIFLHLASEYIFFLVFGDEFKACLLDSLF